MSSDLPKCRITVLKRRLNQDLVAEYLNVEELQALVSATGVWAPIVFFGLTAALIFVGAPRLIFCAIGGALFGFIGGVALSQIATLIGSLGPFLFSVGADGSQRILQTPASLAI